jgi:hypothetical protein
MILIGSYSYFTMFEKPIKAMDKSAADTNSIGVPFKNAGTGLVLSRRLMPASKRRESRNPNATPRAKTTDSIKL